MHYAYGLLFHSCMQKKAIKKIHGLPTSIIFSFRLTPCSNPAKESDERTMCTSGGGGNDLDVQLCPSPMTTFGVVLLSKVTRSEWNREKIKRHGLEFWYRSSGGTIVEWAWKTRHQPSRPIARSLVTHTCSGGRPWRVFAWRWMIFERATQKGPDSGMRWHRQVNKSPHHRRERRVGWDKQTPRFLGALETATK